MCMLSVYIKKFRSLEASPHASRLGWAIPRTPRPRLTLLIHCFVINKANGVKGLSELGLKSIPYQYIQPPLKKESVP